MKRTAILADIHGNAPALAALLADAKQQQCDEYWFLGDIFGYGPLPVTCIHLLDHVSPTIWLMGNHDLSVMRLWQGMSMDDDVIRQMTPGRKQRWVAKWHAVQVQVALPATRARKLASLPTWIDARPGVFAAHGAVLDDDSHTPKNIGANAYVKPWKHTAAIMLDLLHARRETPGPRFIAVGHYHQPFFAIARPTQPYDIDWNAGQNVYLDDDGGSGRWVLPPAEENKTVIINPGSVGQPRFVAGDTRAAYAILEEDENDLLAVHFRRVGYNEGELRAAKVLMPPENSRNSDDWWSAIEPILEEWIEKESIHEA